MTTFRTGIEPLDTCPVEWLVAFVGLCGTCYRPMARRRRMAVHPELARWFARSMNASICGSCHWRLYTDKTGRKRKPRKPAKTSQLNARRIRELRALVGACLDCGWAPGFGDGHYERACPTQVKIEMRDTA